MFAKIIDDRTIHIYDKTQFDWHAIRNCGQIFREPPCEVLVEKDRIVIAATGSRNSKWLWDYFDLDTDYSVIKKELLLFKPLREPMATGGGIRILRQPFHETVVSFIISANNNIKRFEKIIARIDFENLEKYSEEDFKNLGCGYRAPYLVKAIKQLSAMDADTLSEVDNATLRKRLMELSGVGRKVADCIMLFAFHRLDNVPVDVHIGRAIEHLGANGDEIFKHRYAGVAQQYIFFYIQHMHKKLS